jgi:hypothetical protein
MQSWQPYNVACRYSIKKSLMDKKVVVKVIIFKSIFYLKIIFNITY